MAVVAQETLLALAGMEPMALALVPVVAVVVGA